MAVYKDIKVDIPKEHVTIERCKNGKPAMIKYVLSARYDREKGYPIAKRTIIGYQCFDEPGKMHPTTQYKELFPDLWETTTGHVVTPAVKRIGLFALSQSINDKTGIKDLLNEAYGIETANAVMDYALYSLRLHTDVMSAYQDSAKNELLYANTTHSDSWYSDLFDHRMTREQILRFRKGWALQCHKDGVEEVWLCIDGSNDDCSSKGVEIAEKGAAKSKKDVNIVSFTYAVTEQGLPVTFDLYQGGLVDAKALRSITDFLNECGIRLKGVILDRGYCDQHTLEYLNGEGIPYIIMVKGKPDGLDAMVAAYGQAIKMNVKYLIEGTCLFGVQQKVQLFSKYKHDDYVTLFFDYQNGGDRVTALLKNVYKALSLARKAIAKGKKPKIEAKYSNLISIDTQIVDGTEQVYARINPQSLQEAIDSKGLYGIVSSQEMTPADVHAKYTARDASETQFMILKTQLGYGTVRVQCTNSVYSKFMTAFVASVLRYEIQQASKPLEKTAAQMIREVDLLEMRKISDVYAYTHTEKNRVTALFSNLDADAAILLDGAVKFENDRIAGKAPVLRHRKTGPKKGSHHKQYDADGNMVPRKPGVKPGTKRADINQDGTPRKKPGILTGTKRGVYNKDGSLRQKPGPKSGSKRQPNSTDNEN